MDINKTILKVLKTKVGQETPEKELLESIGFIVFNGSNSTQNYYSVKNPETGRELVISKSYGGRACLFGPYNHIKEYKEIGRVDLYNYLKTPVRPGPSGFNPLEYTGKKSGKLNKQKTKIEYLEMDIERERKEYERVKNNLNKSISEYNDEIRKLNTMRKEYGLEKYIGMEEEKTCY